MSKIYFIYSTQISLIFHEQVPVKGDKRGQRQLFAFLIQFKVLTIVQFICTAEV